MQNAPTDAAVCPMHAPADHPKIKPAKVGVLLANLGTPDGTDYWSMRRYLSEFLSDKRVVDYSAWLWQPLLPTHHSFKTTLYQRCGVQKHLE